MAVSTKKAPLKSVKAQLEEFSLTAVRPHLSANANKRVEELRELVPTFAADLLAYVLATQNLAEAIGVEPAELLATLNIHLDKTETLLTDMRDANLVVTWKLSDDVDAADIKATMDALYKQLRKVLPEEADVRMNARNRQMRIEGGFVPEAQDLINRGVKAGKIVEPATQEVVFPERAEEEDEEPGAAMGGDDETNPLVDLYNFILEHTPARGKTTDARDLIAELNEQVEAHALLKGPKARIKSLKTLATLMRDLDDDALEEYVDAAQEYIDEL